MRQHSFPDARSLHGLTAPPGRDVAFWHLSDIKGLPTNVRCWGQSERYV